MRLDHYGALVRRTRSLASISYTRWSDMLVARDVPRTRMDAGSHLGERRSQLPCGANCPVEFPTATYTGADRAHSACFRQASAIEHSLPHETVGSTCLQLTVSDPRGDDYRTVRGWAARESNPEPNGSRVRPTGVFDISQDRAK